MVDRKYIADFSLALINRTGAYYICRDVVDSLPNAFAIKRYWRLLCHSEPQGLTRKLLGRGMLAELAHANVARFVPWPRRPDVPTLFFDPLYVLNARLETRDIVLCHDVGPVSHPELFPAKVSEMYRRAYASIQRAKPGMVFVSETSRAAFAHRFGTDYRFLRVIPLYVRTPVTSGETRQPDGVTPPFFLTVAGLEIRKNHRRIIAAYEQSGLREQGYQYVICGPRGNSAEDVQQLAAATSGVVNLGYASDAELRWLYQNASTFVLPSLLEGFGVPPLEAAQYGLISIVSADGAQQEAVGEGAIVVDPLSVESIAEGMRQVADMPQDERARRVGLAREHARRLSKERYIARWAALLQGLNDETGAPAPGVSGVSE
jgi:glycosyltransferase involved in cell wall biosynthesis